MSSVPFRPRPLSLAVAVFVAAAGLSVERPAAANVVFDESGHAMGPSTAVIDHSAQAKYIVRFKELPLALYDGSVPGLAAIPRTSEPGRRSRLDTHSASAQAYISYVTAAQSQHAAAIAALLGRATPVERQMRYALNAIVVTMTADEARKVATLDVVAGVTRDENRQLTTDIGPAFIGATSLWWGAQAGVDTLFAGGFDANATSRGEGVVIGDIDTGYNSNSPSFAGSDDSGYAFINPLGSGNYLGLCNPSYQEQPAATLFSVPFAGCNNKVIGAYDFIDPFPAPAPPPVTTYSSEDYQGHGSHTASTAGGNTRNAAIGAYTARISGVAPHANMVIFYTCNIAGCPISATSAAVDQAVQDGVVDALNFSISGGANPWTDPVSLAFLSATESGIFIAAAAGNTSAAVPNPLPGTVDHLEPWVTTVAASNHSGGPLGYFLAASGDGAPPAIGMNTAPASTQPTGPIATTLQVSPNFTAPNDCATFPGGTFTGSMAILHFVNGPCGTNTLSAHALAAGAAQVLLVNSTDDYINAGAAQALPVFTTTSTQGNALVAYVTANSGVTANVSFPANTRLPVKADALANFSLIGPGTFNVIKPDVEAPGTSILAAFNNANPPAGSPPVAVPPNGAATVAFDDGTSMSTPHTTGSGALLASLHPDWTPMEIKSALMMTAKETGLTKADHVTPSDFYDRGAGRLQDDIAAHAGLVLNETGLNFLNADPSAGGDPRTLNLASMQNANCVTSTGPTSSEANCAFTRKLHSTQNTSVTWTASLSGVSGSVTPSSIAVVAHGTRSVTVSVDASAYASDGTSHFGELVLTPGDAGLPTLHLPIAVALQPPTIAASPTPLTISIPGGSTTAGAALTVANVGGPTLTVTNTNDQTSLSGSYAVLDQPSQGNRGDYSDFFPDFGEGIYEAEDFATTASTTNISKLSFPGFTTGATALAGFPGAAIHFEIYADNGGAPNGNPETVAPSYLWSYVATIGSTPGLNVVGNTISIDLNAAGATATALPPGTYWIVVYPELDFGSGAWAWFESVTTFGATAQVINPAGDFGIGTDWIAITDPLNGDTFPGMAAHVEGLVPCGAPWLAASPPTLSLDGATSASVTVTANSALFPPAQATASAFLCLDSNDPATPVLAVPVTAIQNN